MSSTARPRVVLDTHVIFSRVLHDLFGRLARDLQLFDIIWSDELLDETVRVLVERKPMDPLVARRWVSYLTHAFPDGRIDLAAVPADVDLSSLTSDPDDEHVCALALAGHASTLVAADAGYDAAALGGYGVELTSPDAFLLRTYEVAGALVLDVLRAQANAWAGGRSLSELLAALERAQVAGFVERIRAELS